MTLRGQIKRNSNTSSVNTSNTAAAAASAAAASNYYSSERLYEEVDQDRRLRRRRARLVAAAEDAFAHVKRLHDGRSKSELVTCGRSDLKTDGFPYIFFFHLLWTHNATKRREKCVDFRDVSGVFP